MSIPFHNDYIHAERRVELSLDDKVKSINKYKTVAEVLSSQL